MERLLRVSGIDVNCRNRDGETALHKLCEGLDNGQDTEVRLVIMVMLTQAGCDKLTKDNVGFIICKNME